MGPVFHITDSEGEFKVHTEPTDVSVEIRGPRDLAEKFNLFQLQDIADGFNVWTSGNKFDVAGTLWAHLESNVSHDTAKPVIAPKRAKRMFKNG